MKPPGSNGRGCPLQQWFNLSDPAGEEAWYDSPVMRQFAGIDLGGEPVHGSQDTAATTAA